MRVLMSKRTVVAVLALGLGLSGCASAGGGGGSSGPRSSPTRIIRDELAEMQQLDAYTVVQRIRPRWLQLRANEEPTVFVDGARRSGGLTELRSIRVQDIQMMEYMSASDASTRFGTGFQGGAILVTTIR